MKRKNVLSNNIWLIAAAIIVLLLTVVIGWKCGTTITEHKKDVVNTSLETQRAEESKQEWSVKYTEEGAVLMDLQENILCGPYQYIYEGDIGVYNHVFRFIGENGLIGYASVEGNELVDSIFTSATQVSDGSACVCDMSGEVYYITESGERFTYGKYLEGYPFGESQGMCARVRMRDGSWAVINREEEYMISGCDYICELSYVTTIISGVRDGKAILFDYYGISEENPYPKVIKEYDEYVEISALYMNKFAVVKNSEGQQGVVYVWNGEVILEAEYTAIEWELLYSYGESQRDIWVFRAQRNDGTYEVVIWEP